MALFKKKLAPSNWALAANALALARKDSGDSPLATEKTFFLARQLADATTTSRQQAIFIGDGLFMKMKL